MSESEGALSLSRDAMKARFAVLQSPISEFEGVEHLQGSAKRLLPGLVYCVPVVAYHFCLSLPTAFTQPRAHL